ncbi:Imm8 family immunity protein [Paenibacillus kyungheensis]
MFKIDIEIGREYLIMNDFNIKHIESTVNQIISKCQNADYDVAMKGLSKYFRWEMDT